MKKGSIQHLLLAITLAIAGAWPAAGVVPQLVDASPADGVLLTTDEVVLEGRFDGAATLKVDGQDVAVAADGSFRAGPYSLAEGQRTFVLVAVSADGEETQLLHRVARDSRAPTITVRRPVRRVLAASPVTVAGTIIDLNLTEVLVDGRPATVKGSTFSAQVALTEGLRTIENRRP